MPPRRHSLDQPRASRPGVVQHGDGIAHVGDRAAAGVDAYMAHGADDDQFFGAGAVSGDTPRMKTKSHPAKEIVLRGLFRD